VELVHLEKDNVCDQRVYLTAGREGTKKSGGGAITSNRGKLRRGRESRVSLKEVRRD